MASNDEIIIRSVGGTLTHAVEIGPHRLVADEPVSLGGEDKGPTPYELLAAALGSCVAITLRMYADRKGYPLEGVEVRLQHDKIYAKDCDECETETGRIDRIRKHLVLTGPLTEEQRADLIRIAEKCPVQKTLNREVSIETTVA